jgi:hypothetical protein
VWAVRAYLPRASVALHIWAVRLTAVPDSKHFFFLLDALGFCALAAHTSGSVRLATHTRVIACDTKAMRQFHTKKDIF